MSEGPEETTLGDIAEVVMGQSPPGSTYNEDGDGLPFLQGSAEFGEHYPVPVKWCSQPKKIAEAGDLLVSVRAPVGDTNFADQRTAIGRGLAVIRGKSNSLTEYLRLAIQTQVGALNAASGSGMFSSITAKNLKGFRVDLPPLSGQRRTVDLITSVDAYIDALRAQTDAARSARTSLLHELLNAGGDEWTDAVLSDLLRRSIGGVWGSEEGSGEVDVTVVRSTEFTSSGYLNFATGVRRSCTARQLASRELQEGDILLEKSGGGPKQPVGRVVYVTDEIPNDTVCANFVQLVSPDPEAVCPRFVFLLMWLWHSEGRTLGYQAQTTGIRNLRTQDYLAQTIRLPPRADQEAIVDIASVVGDLVTATKEAIAVATRLRNGLLSELLSGDHEIPESYDALLKAS